MNGPSPWSALVSADAGTQVVTLRGELDLSAADDLRELLLRQLDIPDATDVVADLTAVSFLDSAALGSLITAYQHAEDTGRVFTLTNPARAVRLILDISGVTEILVRPLPGEAA